MKEFSQLEDLHVYEAVNARLLTNEQCQGALQTINLIKEKRTGQIKGRKVADGRVQKTLYHKAVVCPSFVGLAGGCMGVGMRREGGNRSPD